MAKTVGRNININDTSAITTISSISNTTTVTALSINTTRIYVSASNEGPGSVFVKLQAASVNNDLKGDIVQSGQTWWMTPDNMYTGEISLIAKTGSGPKVHLTEY